MEKIQKDRQTKRKTLTERERDEARYRDKKEGERGREDRRSKGEAQRERILKWETGKKRSINKKTEILTKVRGLGRQKKT